MTDRILTPEIYGDFGLFLDQIGVCRKPAPQPAPAAQAEPETQPKEDPNGWYKRGEECPF